MAKVTKGKVERSARRNFLKGAASAGGAAALMAGGKALAAEPATGEAKKGSAGYQESAHVREYYKTATI